MTPFHLKIVTPDAVQFDGQAEALILRATGGDLGVLAGHMNCVATLGMGRATVVIAGKRRCGACIGGMLSVRSGTVTLLPTTFEWAEDIDVKRAESSCDRARKILSSKQSSDTDLRLAEARLKRALVRKSIGSAKGT